MPYATVADLSARWGNDFEDARASVLLADASVEIDVALQSAGIDPEDVSADILSRVSCAMVKRALSIDDIGVSSTQMTAGPFSQTQSYSNPMGDLYLTKAEKKLLGIGKQRIGTIMPSIGAQQ